MRARRWTITLNNYSEEDLRIWKALTTDTVKYLIFGEESAPTTGTAHLQGYVEFTSLKTMAQVKSLFGERIHLEKAKGTGQQNQTYCSKGENIVEVGTLVIRGQRTDLQEIQELIRTGASEMEIATNYFSQWIRYRNSFQAYRSLVNARRIVVQHELSSFPEAWRRLTADEVKSDIIWGPSGIGKTSFAKALFPNALFVSHIDDLRHFNSELYDAIIFDDMDFKHLPRSSQIHLVDFDDHRSIHVRYGVASIPAGTKKIFLTNEPEGRIFQVEDPAIRRRVRVHHFDHF